jgi:hypothetical protein
LPGVRDLLVRAGALLEGHFRLQSGLHSPYFVRVGQLAYRPEDARVLGEHEEPGAATLGDSNPGLMTSHDDCNAAEVGRLG